MEVGSIGSDLIPMCVSVLRNVLLRNGHGRCGEWNPFACLLGRLHLMRLNLGSIYTLVWLFAKTIRFYCVMLRDVYGRNAAQCCAMQYTMDLVGLRLALFYVNS